MEVNGVGQENLRDLTVTLMAGSFLFDKIGPGSTYHPSPLFRVAMEAHLGTVGSGERLPQPRILAQEWCYQ